MTTSATPAPTPRDSFSSFLQDLEDGRFIGNCGMELQTLVREMKTLEMAGILKCNGKLTLEIDIKNDSGVFDVNGSVKVRMPKRPRTRSIMYAKKDGSLTSHNPHQTDLGLADVHSTAAQGGLRKV